MIGKPPWIANDKRNRQWMIDWTNEKLDQGDGLRGLSSEHAARLTPESLAQSFRATAQWLREGGPELELAHHGNIKPARELVRKVFPYLTDLVQLRKLKRGEKYLPYFIDGATEISEPGKWARPPRRSHPPPGRSLQGLAERSRAQKTPCHRGGDRDADQAHLGRARASRLSPQTIRELARRGVIAKAGKTFPVAESYRRYAAHLRAGASARSGPASASVAAQRARVLRLQGDKLAAENDRASTEWILRAEVARQWAARFAGIRSAILAWPVGCSAFLDRDTLARLDAEAREPLSDIADGKYDVKDDPHARR